MANSITHAALPYCICGARFSLVLGFETAAGVPTDPASSDTEYSVDGGASFADCAEEITAGGSAGVGYLTLTGAETNNSVLVIRSRSGNCDDATRVIPIMALASVGTGTLSAGSAGGGTLGTILAYDVTGCFIKTTGGTGGGGTGGANNQARKIATYNTSTGAFTVSPNWETTPDNTTTYAVLLPEGVTLGMLQTINPATPGRKPVIDADGLVDATTVKVGPTGSGTAQTAGDIPALINTVDDFLDTEIAAIKAKTDNLPTDPADQSAVESAITAATSPLATAANLAVVAGYIDTEIAAIKAVTDAIGATGSGLSAIPWNAAWDDEVQSEVQDAIEANNLDHLVKSAVDTDFATTVHVDSVVGQLAQTADGGFARASDSLEAIRDRGDLSWITGGGGGGLTQQNIDDIVEGVTDALGDNELQLIQPELAGELKQTTQGMAYNDTIGNRLEWLDINQDWPTLTGGTVTLKIGQGGTPLTFSGSVITATGSPKKVAVELTAVQSATITAAEGEDNDAWPYIIYISLSGVLRELRRGRWISTPLPT